MKRLNVKKMTILVCIILFIIVFFVVFHIKKSNNKLNNETSTNTTVNETKTIEDIKSPEDLYSAISVDILPLKQFPENYSIYDAIEDGYFVVSGAKAHNDNLYEEFMNAYKGKKQAFIRIVNTTDEGDVVLYDVAYLPQKDKVYIITDYTRDDFSSIDDRKIEVTEYEKIGTYNSYWVAYNGDIKTAKENDIFYIATIN